jgi:hypothetical protein
VVVMVYARDDSWPDAAPETQIADADVPGLDRSLTPATCTARSISDSPTDPQPIIEGLGQDRARRGSHQGRRISVGPSE